MAKKELRIVPVGPELAPTFGDVALAIAEEKAAKARKDAGKDAIVKAVSFLPGETEVLLRDEESTILVGQKSAVKFKQDTDDDIDAAAQAFLSGYPLKASVSLNVASAQQLALIRETLRTVGLVWEEEYKLPAEVLASNPKLPAPLAALVTPDKTYSLSLQKGK